MIFVSDFLRADVVDVHQRTVGKVRDLIVRMGDPYPVVIALALRGHSAPPTIDWSVVRAWEAREISLNVAAADLVPHTPIPEEVWLSRDILDKQIVDMDGRRVVRVNDLQLSQVEGSMLLVGVDSGSDMRPSIQRDMATADARPRLSSRSERAVAVP